MRLDRKLICISSSDTAWSRAPPMCPRGAQEIRKNNYEKKKNRTQHQLCTLCKDREVTSLTRKWIRSSYISSPSVKRLHKFLWITSALFPPNKIISVHCSYGRPLPPSFLHTQIIGLVIFWLKMECPDCLWFIKTGPY